MPGTPARSGRETKSEALAALLELVPSLFFKLKSVTDALHAADGLGTAERGVLRDLVERGPLTAPQLAALRPVSRQAIQVVLDRLLERALVSYEDNPRHRRSLLYVPTREGRAAMRGLRRREAAGLAALLDAFDAAELHGAADVASRLDAMLAREIERSR